MYLVQVKEGVDWTKEAMTLDNAWTIKGFPAGEIITVRVASLNKCGQSFSEPFLITCHARCSKPDEPIVIVERTSATQALIKWDKIPAAFTYQVELTQPNKGWE